MIKKIYVYLVLFATLMMVVGGSVGAFMSIADIVAPAPYYQTFDDYARFNKQQSTKMNENSSVDVEIEAKSEEELKEDYENMVTAHKNRNIARAKNSLIKSFGWILIPGLIFIYFQRKILGPLKKDE